MYFVGSHMATLSVKSLKVALFYDFVELASHVLSLSFEFH